MELQRILSLKMIASLLVFCHVGLSQAAAQPLDDFEQSVYEIAIQCRDEVEAEFLKIINANTLSYNQLFDTFYIPTPNTSPQKYSTQYDKVTDAHIRIILDKYLDMDRRLLFVVAVDRNGYVPTHNSKYSQPLTNDPDFNAKNNRTKRLFNDRTGLAAARNTEQYLLQKYNRDTGETVFDLSLPLMIKGKHWGAIRIGFVK